ncbi:helix-turn-helix domain-containing protein [Mobilibacterium timonense]|uniref:hypothetical protein n=1 Tax=Mobilibacterium timonense TaxID=1871012 RepID=UPI000986CEF3|nr:hypothetical protein [Mobilibacterium timonense]
MNKNELEAEMKRYGDTGAALASYLNMARSTLSNKMNGKAEFTQGEITAIKERYSLTPTQIDTIFFLP